MMKFTLKAIAVLILGLVTSGAAFAETEKMFKAFKWGMAYVAPRGIGPTAWGQAERRQTQVRRRFTLLGQTLDGIQWYPNTGIPARAMLRMVNIMFSICSSRFGPPSMTWS